MTVNLLLWFIMWIDSHCHLDGFDKQGRLDEILARAGEKGVAQMIAIGTEPGDWAWGKNAAERFSGKIFYTAGLHPNHVSEHWEEDVRMLETYVGDENSKTVAWGEIGLDFFRLPADEVKKEQVRQWQYSALRAQFDLFRKNELPIVIHSRNCFEETFKEIKDSGISGERFVFHCYSYGIEEIELLNAIGARASFTGVITYKSAEPIREAAKCQGLDKVMIETDCPYLAPVPHRGEINEPSYLAETGTFCATLFGLSAEAFAAHATANTRQFFKI